MRGTSIGIQRPIKAADNGLADETILIAERYFTLRSVGVTSTMKLPYMSVMVRIVPPAEFLDGLDRRFLQFHIGRPSIPRTKTPVRQSQRQVDRGVHEAAPRMSMRKGEAIRRIGQ